MDRSGTEYQCVHRASSTGLRPGIDHRHEDAGELTPSGFRLTRPAGTAILRSCKIPRRELPPAVEAYVSLLNADGLVAILDLHWSDGQYAGGGGCSSVNAVCQKPMPDAAQSVPFWTSVAKAFKGE